MNDSSPGRPRPNVKLARDMPAKLRWSDRYIRSASIRQRTPRQWPITLGIPDHAFRPRLFFPPEVQAGDLAVVDRRGRRSRSLPPPRPPFVPPHPPPHPPPPPPPPPAPARPPPPLSF